VLYVMYSNDYIPALEARSTMKLAHKHILIPILMLVTLFCYHTFHFCRAFLALDLGMVVSTCHLELVPSHLDSSHLPLILENLGLVQV